MRKRYWLFTWTWVSGEGGGDGGMGDYTKEFDTLNEVFEYAKTHDFFKDTKYDWKVADAIQSQIYDLHEDIVCFSGEYDIPLRPFGEEEPYNGEKWEWNKHGE